MKKANDILLSLRNYSFDTDSLKGYWNPKRFPQTTLLEPHCPTPGLLIFFPRRDKEETAQSPVGGHKGNPPSFCKGDRGRLGSKVTLPERLLPREAARGRRYKTGACRADPARTSRVHRLWKTGRRPEERGTGRGPIGRGATASRPGAALRAKKRSSAAAQTRSSWSTQRKFFCCSPRFPGSWCQPD